VKQQKTHFSMFNTVCINDIDKRELPQGKFSSRSKFVLRFANDHSLFVF